MKRLLSCALVIALSVLATGCGDLGTGPAASLSGSYSLRSLDSSPVPASLYYYSATDHLEVISSQLVLRADGTYTDYTRVQDTQGAYTRVYDDNTAGDWSLSGSQLALRDRIDYSHVSYGNVTNGRITIDNFAGYNVRAEYVR